MIHSAAISVYCLKSRQTKMSTFYSTPNDQSGTTVNLCPKIPGTVPHSESQFPSNIMYLSFSNSGSYADAFVGSTRAHQNQLDIPGASTIISQGITGGSSDMLASRLSNHACNALKDGRNQMLCMQTLDGSMNGAGDLVCADGPQMNLQSQLVILNGQSSSLPQASMHNQGLSLSLSSQMPLPSIHHQSAGSNLSFIGAHQSTSGNAAGPSREDSFESRTMSGNVSSNGHSNLTCLIPNSKYLRGMQELLDEVVNVSKTLKQKTEKSEGRHASNTMIGKVGDGGLMADGTKSNPTGTAENSSHELSTSERQDLQNKVRKLLGMLDEVDRRYKQYFHQMQIIVSCFDAVAGSGAAKPYTSLALQTISRHFRCLRDAIAGQIQATKQSLGEPDNSCTRSGLSRLPVIDQQLRQRCGVIQQHPWRPQRGLPESSVSILRAWLFEHFLHPYPKDSEKLVLARQTGLTRSQVSNWFINARVRLWKPMIEGMYKEEFGDIEIDSNSSSENPPILKEDIQSSGEREELQNPAHARRQASQISDSPRPSLVSTVDVAESIAPYQNESTTQDSYMNLKINDQRPIGEYSSFFQDALAHPERGGRFFAYQMTEIGQCGRDGVSLTLGLQQCDSGLPVSDNQQSFLTMSGNEVYGSAAPASADATDYDYANAGDQQLRYSSTQLLHDFVT